MMIAITPMARNPGISRTVCSQPISAPSNCATSITKLLSSADHVAKAIGIPKAIKANRAHRAPPQGQMRGLRERQGSECVS